MASRDLKELYTNGDERKAGRSPAKHILSWKGVRSPSEFSRMIHGLRVVLPSKWFSGWAPETDLLPKAHGTAGKAKSAQWNISTSLSQRLVLLPDVCTLQGLYQWWCKAQLTSNLPSHSRANVQLGLPSLSALWIPKMPTFSYGRWLQDRSLWSEAGQRSWCSS